MNGYVVSSDIKRALTGKGFLFGVIGLVLVVGLSQLQAILLLSQNGQALQNGYHALFITNALSSDWVTMAIPILCALPYTASFVDDIKGGFIKQFMFRSNKKQYIAGKIIACGLSGGLVLLMGVILSYSLSALIFTPMELALKEGEIAPPYFAQALMQAALFFFSGGFWSLVGFTCASATMNKYMAFASPFILYYLLIILNERYFPDLYVLYPKQWLFPKTDLWVLGSYGVIVLLLVLMAILCLGFALIAQRRLQNV